ncbi:MAG: hypothetical protein IJG45_05795 [Oscillospiraceae bacterium]|nr:hypothetical protein [Oscillospiraceae bacterium]
MIREISVRLGAITVRYTGELPEWKENSLVRRFLTADRAPDVTVNLTPTDRIDPPEGRLLWETREQLVSRTENGTAHYHRGIWDDAPFFARLTRRDASPERLEVHFVPEHLLHRNSDSMLLGWVEMERLFHERQQALFHAAWVMREGKALLFSGACGVGKSTQAELWHTYRGARIINGDKTCLSFHNGGLTAFGTPFCGSSRYCEDGVAPVRAIVMLEQAPTDTIRRLSLKEAVRALASQMPCQKWLADDVAAVLEYAELAARRVPVYLLSCTKEESAVDLLDQTLKEEESYAGTTHF